jgi:glycine cleavage system H lipoate-binding protein
VENTKARWEIKSPVSGEVLDVNPEMYGGKATVVIMKDAYGGGWIVELKKVSETESELQQLHGEGTPETKQWLQEQTKAIVPLLESEDESA